MAKSPAERLAQIEQDIKDHKEAEQIEQIRYDRESLSWTPQERADFMVARRSSAAHLIELVEMRRELTRKAE